MFHPMVHGHVVKRCAQQRFQTAHVVPEHPGQQTCFRSQHCCRLVVDCTTSICCRPVRLRNPNFRAPGHRQQRCLEGLTARGKVETAAVAVSIVIGVVDVVVVVAAVVDDVVVSTAAVSGERSVAVRGPQRVVSARQAYQPTATREDTHGTLPMSGLSLKTNAARKTQHDGLNGTREECGPSNVARCVLPVVQTPTTNNKCKCQQRERSTTHAPLPTVMLLVVAVFAVEPPVLSRGLAAWRLLNSAWVGYCVNESTRQRASTPRNKECNHATIRPRTATTHTTTHATTQGT